MSLETLLLRERHYCESPTCLNKANVMREINGHLRVMCWQHDPETITSFSQWLESTNDSLPLPTSLSEWLGSEDSIFIG